MNSFDRLFGGFLTVTEKKRIGELDSRPLSPAFDFEPLDYLGQGIVVKGVQHRVGFLRGRGIRWENVLGNRSFKDLADNFDAGAFHYWRGTAGVTFRW